MPRPTKEDAIRRIKLQLDYMPELRHKGRNSPAFVGWRRDTIVAIKNTFGEASNYHQDFESVRFEPQFTVSYGILEFQYLTAHVEGLDSAAAILRSMINEIQEYWSDDPQESFSPDATETPQPVNTNRVFVIHGRDHGTRDSVARFLESLGLVAVILEEQPDRGLTVIEKFEVNAKGDFVVALLTPDDVGGPNPDKLQPRARQNVVFELGYFVRAFGRNRVRALMKGEVEIPSDYAGVLYIPMDESGGWQMRLIREMKSAGLDIDANRAYE